MQTSNRYFAAAVASLGAVVVAAGLLLLGPVRAQAKGTSNQGHMGMMGVTMDAMDMSGTATRGDKPYDVALQDDAYRQAQDDEGHGRDGDGYSDEDERHDDHMGQKYRCDMEMTPKTK